MLSSDDADVVLVVDEWDLTGDEGDATPAEAGVRPGQRFPFSAADLARLVGIEENDGDAYEHAMASLLNGEDVEGLHEAMMDEVSSGTGWCILASHVESPEGDETRD